MRNVSLNDIFRMEDDELLEYVMGECIERGIIFDAEDLGDSNRRELFDFIADNLNPEWQGELHSECAVYPGCNMFPNVENQAELNEAMEHEFVRD